jgi:hypothetical protein
MSQVAESRESRGTASRYKRSVAPRLR